MHAGFLHSPELQTAVELLLDAGECYGFVCFLCSGLACHLLAFLLNCTCRDRADRERISHHTIPNNNTVKA